MSDESEVPTEEFRNCINIPNRQTEKLNEQIARNNVLEEENIKLREKVEQKEKELAELREALSFEESRLAPLEEWMKIQIKEVRSATDRLTDGFMTAYKTILEKGVEKSQTTSSSDRRRLAEEIQGMEDVCEDVSKDAIKTSEKCLEKITFHPNRVEMLPQEKLNDKSENKPIDAFLGEFAAVEVKSRLPYFGTEDLPIHKIIIQKAKQEGYFETVWKSDNGKEDVSLSWKPDNVQRSESRYRIEKNVLISFHKQKFTFTYYELTDQGLKMDRNHLYNRI